MVAILNVQANFPRVFYQHTQWHKYIHMCVLPYVYTIIVMYSITSFIGYFARDIISWRMGTPTVGVHKINNTWIN